MINLILLSIGAIYLCLFTPFLGCLAILIILNILGQDII